MSINRWLLLATVLLAVALLDESSVRSAGEAETQAQTAHAWYLTSSPILTFNWEASAGNEWLVPFGGGIGKIFKLGKLPLNGTVQAYYNVRADDATTLGRWQARVQLAFLFPSGNANPAAPESSDASALLIPAATVPAHAPAGR